MNTMRPSEDPGASGLLSLRARWLWLLMAVFVFLLDLGTKAVVVSQLAYGDRVQIYSFFAWVRWHNEGAAFSFLANAGGWQRWFFVSVGVAFSIYIIREVLIEPIEKRLMGLVYALILGGALGNLYDRALNGYVVDFILVHYQGYYFPAFNVADSALFSGIVIWMLLLFFSKEPLERTSH